MPEMDHGQIFALAVIFILGVGATVAYYFARYYFRTHREDKEVVEGAVLGEIQQAPSPPGLRAVLAPTRSQLFGRLKEIFLRDHRLAKEDLEYLEEVLYTSDLGPTTVERLMAAIRSVLTSEEQGQLDSIIRAIRLEILKIFASLGGEWEDSFWQALRSSNTPHVWMVVGVNGVGKTTTIGKLANAAAQAGLKVMVVAGDTFRAAAGDQLRIWSERANVEIFSPADIKDPSAVVFDGMQRAKVAGFDLVIVDTAGRLHTQANLMEELKKIKRTMLKVIPGTPQETLLVVDANSGQNALLQAKAFHEALDLTGIILTKLDGTAKGGVAVSIACELGLPIRLIGVGEGAGDLRSFHADEFVAALI